MGDIRQFRSSDFPQVRTLLFEGFVTGEGSVARSVKRSFLLKPPSVLACLCIGVGLVLGWTLPVAEWTSATGAAAAALIILGSAVLAGLRVFVTRSMIGFCEDALAGDLRDIPAHFCAPGAFFVAVRAVVAEKPHRDDDLKTGEEEVLGCVGLEYLPEKDAKAAEIRRMLVTTKHRRLGLASRLMLTTIQHAETMPGVECIKLSTSEFQAGAQRLYEGLGWERAATHIHQVGIIRASMRDYRRPVRRGEYGEIQARAERGAELRRILER
ncbi:hypothetical protein C8R46DRAFT_1349332 [Mycena filopes]|nr:hypothetical protein C8R46DRAFT_1349332 [Mycena filopes]